MKTKAISLIFVCCYLLLFHVILIPAADAANKIMCLGDSVTQGTSSGVEDEAFQIAYRKGLYDLLKADGYVVNDEIFVGTLFSGEAVADFDPDHEGHGGFWADELVDGRTGREAEGVLSDWLPIADPNIILLHVGTNDISWYDEDSNDIERILTVIDEYKLSSGHDIWVVLALIINRSCDPASAPCTTHFAATTAYNDEVLNNVFFPRQAAGDKIVVVDMENNAGIDYARSSNGGDMFNELHPFETGYTKMADLWYSGLMDFLPQADAGLDQDVNEFATVTLDASASINPNGGSLFYRWHQIAGSTVTLSDDQVVQPTFDVPTVEPAGETLTFRVTVTDADGLQSTDTVDINILNCPGDFDNDGYVDGVDLAEYVRNPGGLTLDVFAEKFGKSSCL